MTDVRAPLDEVPRDGGGDGDGRGEGWSERDGSAMIDPADAPPEVQEAMREYMRKYEESWLDEPVPALDGMTPREAVADPTRRSDVERLLASFAPRDDDFGMDPQRISELLGLDRLSGGDEGGGDPEHAGEQQDH